jgi:hypothetical protein
MKTLRTVVLAMSCAVLLPLVAAAKLAIPDPFTPEPCTSPDDVITDLEAPTGLYSNAGAQCPAVCRRAEKMCERYVKLAVSCLKSNLQDGVVFVKLSCNATLSGPALKTCLENIGHEVQQGRQLLDSGQRGDIAQCQTWGTECVGSCP